MASLSYHLALGIFCIAGLILQGSLFGQISDGFSGPGDLITLIVYKPAQGELDLSEDQRTAAKEISHEFRDSLKKLYANGLQDEELRKATDRSIDRANEKVGELLLPEQLDRLKQISLRIREDIIKFSLTTVELLDEELCADLGVSNEQASKLIEESKGDEKARKDLAQKMKALRFKSKRAQQDYIYEQVGKTALKHLMDVLTPEQLIKLDQLKGPDFEYSIEDLPL